ncbi:MAG: DegT/DnrJ/EryC1/StrS family aminotransferase [Bacteroidia bacterium]
MINVTKTFLPELSEYESYLKKIWEKGWITNNGECVVELERQLKSYLKVPDLWFCNNGTIVLQFAIKALELKGEIITTPFSYVATISSILWEHCTPVFVDIEPTTLTINADLIEDAITERTSGILATHVYGNPCDVEKIKQIADQHHLKIIYDAAHCFAVEYKGTNICNYGDISTLSFHATKLFHTIEGGAIITADETLSRKIYLMRQFGHVGDEHFILGLNGKVSEFHAAMGLCVLPKIDDIITERKSITENYNELLDNKKIERPQLRPGTKYNYAYYPILLKDENTLHKVMDELKKEEIVARRYFYPSLNTLPYLESSQSCPVSEDVSLRVLSLPLFTGLERKNIQKISEVILKSI